MPLGKGVRYRFKRLGKGKAVRLAFRGSKAIEVTKFRKGKRGVLVKASKPKKLDRGFMHDVQTVSSWGMGPKIASVVHGNGQRS